MEKDALKETDPRRRALYGYARTLARAYANLANDMRAAGYSAQESKKIKDEVAYYTNVSAAIKTASGDYPDLKLYEPAMRLLLDNYVRADDSKKISAFDDISLVPLIVERGQEGLSELPEEIRGNQRAMAETIENNLRRVIIEEMPTNPIYYEKMSQLLEALIQERQQQVKDYEAYLKEIVELTRNVDNPARTASYPRSINTRAKRALYTTLREDEQRALAVDAKIRAVKKDNWRGNLVKEKAILYALEDTLQDKELAGQIFELVKNQDEY